MRGFDNPRKADPKAKADPGNQYRVRSGTASELGKRERGFPAPAPSAPEGPSSKERRRDLAAKGYLITENLTVFRPGFTSAGRDDWDGWAPWH
jgi:hypothetical protein